MNDTQGKTPTYTDLQSALSDIVSNWPALPTDEGWITVLSGGATAVTLTQLANAFSDLSNFSDLTFNLLPADLPTNFGPLKGDLAAETTLTLQSLEAYLGKPNAGAAAVYFIKFALALRLPQYTVCGIELQGVELSFDISLSPGNLLWSATLGASTTVCGANCDLTLRLPSLLAGIEISSTAGITPDDILSNAGSGISLSSLQSEFSFSDSGSGSSQVAVDSFQATAMFSSSTPIFNIEMALSGLDWSWHTLTVESLAVNFEHGGVDNSFAFALSLDIGGITADCTIEKSGDTAELTTAIYTGGLSLSDWIGDLGTQLSVSVPSALPDVELYSLLLRLSKTDGVIDLYAACSGTALIESSGTSILFDFVVSCEKEASGPKFSLTLTFGSLSFQMSDVNGTLIFLLSAPGAVSLSDLVRALRIDALQELATDLSFSIADAALVFKANQSGGHDILFGLEFSADVALPGEILNFITGGSSVSFSGGVLFLTSVAWSSSDLATISQSGITLPLPSELSPGPTLSGTLNVGGTTASAALQPSGQQLATSAASAPRARSVSSSSATRWFNIEKQLGPIFLGKAGIGLSSRTSALLVACDASFLLGPITVALDDFAVSLPFSAPFNANNIAISLQGMGLTYNKNPLEISGGFLYDQAQDLYSGSALLKTETLYLNASGQYAQIDGATSLALFAALSDPPLGGPVCCFVYGLAAGFGYNSQLQIPQTVEQVASFPLLLAAAPGTNNDSLNVIGECSTPTVGEDWLALGLLFRSFELVDSTVLLTASFGHDLQFALLGQSTLAVPPNEPENLAFAEVDVEGSYLPADNEVKVFGVLTNASYVISQDCHLQGGFAYVLESDGSFVLTFGGYAPDYDYKVHNYPAVPRLEMFWHVDAHTSIKGSEYFAVTPAVMMAGGGLQANWDCGIFSAWFSVAADLFMQWKPFAYAGGFSMSLGVSFDLKILFVHIHFTFHIGASLAIAGPPFHGTAHIDLSVISFDVSFGNSPEAKRALKWHEFRQLLPGKAEDDAVRSSLLAVKVSGGLQKDLSQENKNSSGVSVATPLPEWVVNGTHFSFTLHTSLPITEPASGPNIAFSLAPEEASIGILPMDVAEASGMLTVVIHDINRSSYLTAQTVEGSKIMVSAVSANMPSAYWAKAQPTDTNAAPISATCGYQIYGGVPVPDAAHKITANVSALAARTSIVSAIASRPASTTPFLAS